MAAWMLYALAIGLGASLAALAAERALGLLGAPRRWVWVLALAISALAPVALPFVSSLETRRVVHGPIFSPPGEPVMVLAPEAAPAPTVVERSFDWMAALDAVLSWGWAVASLLGVVILLGSAVSLERVRARWRPARVAGVPVLVSRTAGPAVVGCFWPDIVMPEWVLALTPRQQRLIVAHEREHRWARDPLLLAAGLAAVVLAPWNLALWWQLSRLRLAVEVDCDRRVLAGWKDLKCYGELLLEIGRRSRRSWLPAAAFSEPASFLERRIHAMTFHAPRDRALRAAALITLVAAAPAVLYAAPVVTHPALARVAERLTEPAATPSPRRAAIARAAAERRAEAPAPSAPAAFRIIAFASDPLTQQGTDSVPDGIGGYAYKGVLDRVPELSNKGSIAAIMDRLYPPLLRQAGIGGTVVMQFVIEPDGTVNMRTAKLMENTHAGLVDPTMKALERFRFRPGRVGDRNVRVIIQMPITWNPVVRADTTMAVGYSAVRADTTMAIGSPAQPREVTMTGTPVRDYQATLTSANGNARIIDRAKILIAQRYPALLAEGRSNTASLFVIVAPDGTVRDSRLVRAGEDFAWPAGTPTDFRKVTAIRDPYWLGFAPALIGSGIIWFEL